MISRYYPVFPVMYSCTEREKKYIKQNKNITTVYKCHKSHIISNIIDLHLLPLLLYIYFQSSQVNQQCNSWTNLLLAIFETMVKGNTSFDIRNRSVWFIGRVLFKWFFLIEEHVSASIYNIWIKCSTWRSAVYKEILTLRLRSCKCFIMDLKKS